MKIPFISYGVLYADPAWQYEMWGEDTGYEKSPDMHYDCMTFEEMASLRDDIIFASAPNSVCFMWAVWPKLDEAMSLMAAWGFKYKTGGAWHKKTANNKTQFGTGYIMRSACEPFLIGTHGDPEILNRSTRNLIEEKVRGHSRKPDCVYGMLESLFSGPYLEIFARQTAPGWFSAGNEVDKFTYGID